MNEDLAAFLFATWDAASPPERNRSRWVMDQEWFDEVRRVLDAPPMMTDTHLLGLPIEIRPDGGMPHLIAVGD